MENFEKICRICLLEGDRMMSVFKVNVSRKIMSCASVQVWPNDNLPSQICNKCCAKLHVAFQFKKQCEKSDSKLRTYVAKRNKTKEKEIQNKQESETVKPHENITKHLDPSNKPQEVQQTIHPNPMSMPNQNNYLFVECSGEIMDVHVQDSSFVPNGQTTEQTSISHINSYAPTQNTIHQAPLQIGNYNVQNVIYSTTYPVSLQPLQTSSNMIHNQVLTTIPIHHQPVMNQIQPPAPMTTENKNDNQSNSSDTKGKNEDNSQDNPNQCPICMKQFLNVTKKNRHMKIHSKTDMPYKCNVCSKEFMHGGNYKIHMRMHNNDRPFGCTMCPKRFIQAQDLEKHVRTHTGERPHKCPMCWKAFSTGSNLIAHIRTHTGERPYVCSVCTKAFCQSNELTKHMRTHTGEKSHVCNICQKGFNGSSTLIVHKRSHTGEKPFVCSICTKSFTQSSCLTAHLKRYGDVRYPCDTCNIAFHSEKVLEEHEKTEEHNEKVYKCRTFNEHIGTSESGFDKHILNDHLEPLSIKGS